jgi:PAS domain S-box-containing protein
MRPDTDLNNIYTASRLFCVYYSIYWCVYFIDYRGAHMFVALHKEFRKAPFPVFPTIAGFLSCLLGLAVMVGWHSGNTALVHVHKSFVAMQYTTALGFLLSGASLLLLVWGRVRFSIALAAIVGVFGILTLMEYLFVADFGIDRLFSLPIEIAKPRELTRMAPNTALCFSLTAAALMIPLYRIFSGFRDAILRILGSIIVAFAIVALIGHLGAVETAYWKIDKIGMAVHTAAGFLTLGVGLLTLTRTSLDWKVMWPRWLSGVAAATITFLFICLWQEMDRRETSLVEHELEEEATLFASSLRMALALRTTALEGLAERWRARADLPVGTLQQDAVSLIGKLPGIIAIGRRDSRGRTNWLATSPAFDRAAAEVVAQAVDGRQPAPADDARTLPRMRVATFPEAPLRQAGLVIVSPLVMNKGQIGAIIALVDADASLKADLPKAITAKYGFSLHIGDGAVPTEAISRPGIKRLVFGDATAAIADADWHLRIWAARGPLANPSSRLPNVVMVSGIVVAFFITLLLNYALISRDARRIRESESRLSAILDSTVEGICGMDPHGCMTFVNRAAASLLGFTADEMVGRSMHALVHHHHADGRDYPEADCNIVKAMHAGEGCSREDEVFWKKDGSELSVEYTSRPKIDVFGTFRGVVVVFRDISERKRIEAERTHLIDKLSRSNAELDSFAHIASHDLKEPLRAIHNHSRFLAEDYGGKLDEDGNKRLQRLGFLTERMERLINDLLYYSRLGRQDLSVGPTDLNAVVDDIADTMRDELEVRHATVVVPRTLPTIDCDSVRVTELFRNLIQNAIKYNESGQKEAEVGFRDGVHPVFYVKDNGIGIDPEFHEPIFQLFKRLNSDKAYGQSTGAGLTFVKKIVEQHGGSIWVESSAGSGSTFYFTLHEEAVT